MKRLWITIMTLVISGCAAVPSKSSPAESAPLEQEPAQPVRADLQDFGPAPELNNENWLNTEGPLKLADLRGKVVLLDMWTFGCINCQHIVPSLTEWYDKYNSDGLVIIGNHYPEFTYEADLDNLKDAVKRLQIEYPVVQDNRGNTWRAYNTHYWPTIYLIDKRGDIRYQHIGEGAYQETEAAIQALLKESYP
jgi:thiol-disulfide isomerase/thioredoxin